MTHDLWTALASVFHVAPWKARDLRMDRGPFFFHGPRHTTRHPVHGLPGGVMRETAAYKNERKRYNPTPKRKLRLLPVDVVDDRNADMQQLIRQLERTGDLRIVAPAKMLQARTLYTKKMYSRKKTAKTVGVSLDIVDRWADSFGWDEERKKTEFDWFCKVTEVRRKSIDIDERHDRMFHDLETLVEDTLRRMRVAGDVNPRDLATLAGALKVTMEGRRTIRKMETGVTRKVLEFTANETLFTEFMELVAETASPEAVPAPPRQITAAVAPVIHASAEDVEFEEQDG